MNTIISHVTLVRASFAVLVSALLTLAASTPASATTIVDVTDFGSATPDGSDGRGSSYRNVGTDEFDTTQGWTWYTDFASLVNPITVPHTVSGTVSVGEQEIRVGSGLELDSDVFDLSWGSTTVALRSETYNVGTGTANVDWVYGSGSTGFLNGYYSQDGGTSWTAFTKGVDFTPSAGTLEVLLTRNYANPTTFDNPVLDTTTVSFQAPPPTPEPSSALLLALGYVGMLMRRRHRCSSAKN